MKHFTGNTMISLLTRLLRVLLFVIGLGLVFSAASTMPAQYCPPDAIVTYRSLSAWVGALLAAAAIGFGMHDRSRRPMVTAASITILTIAIALVGTVVLDYFSTAALLLCENGETGDYTRLFWPLRGL